MFKRFGVMLDCSRNAVMKIDKLKDFIDILSRMGYNMLQLYTEDTYEIEGEPYFGYLRGRYTQRELRETDEYARAKGIEVIPCIQTLAHLESLLRWRVYGDVADTDSVLLAEEEKTYALIEKMIRSMRSCFRSGYINIGMDEADRLGLGRYLEKFGYKDRGEIFLNHLNKVVKIAEKYGFKPLIWSDMLFKCTGHEYYAREEEEFVFFSPAFTEKLPQNVGLIYWYYYLNGEEAYQKMFLSHRRLGREFWFAGGAWTWMGFAPKNHYAIKTMTTAMGACRNAGVENVFLTLWGDDGGECSFFSALPSLLYLIERAKGNDCEQAIKARFFEIVGRDFDEFTALDLTCADRCAEENSMKYLFYGDPFLGFLDRTAVEKEDFSSYAQKLSRMVKNDLFSPLFASMAAYAEVMSVKYDLGVKTRSVYKSGDKKALEELISVYKNAVLRLKKFLQRFRERWLNENKPFGLEVHETRIGGLIARMESCKNRLKDFSEKGIAIEELEEEILPFTPSDEKVWFNCWRKNITANKI